MSLSAGSSETRWAAPKKKWYPGREVVSAWFSLSPLQSAFLNIAIIIGFKLHEAPFLESARTAACTCHLHSKHKRNESTSYSPSQPRT